MGTGFSLYRIGEIKIKHHCLPGPPSEPSQSSNTKLTVEMFVLMQMQVWLLQPKRRQPRCSQDTHVRSRVLRCAIPYEQSGYDPVVLQHDIISA